MSGPRSRNRTALPSASGTTTFSRSRRASCGSQSAVPSLPLPSQPMPRTRYSGIGLLQHMAAHRRITLADGADDIANGSAIGPEAKRIDLDLVLDRVAADAGDFGNAGHGRELGPYVPVLEHAAGRDPGPAPRRCTRRSVPWRPHRGRGRELPLGSDAARPLRRSATRCRAACRGDGLTEDERNHRVVDIAGRAHDADAVHALQSKRQRIADLIVNLMRAVPRPGREHDHLIFSERSGIASMGV